MHRPIEQKHVLVKTWRMVYDNPSHSWNSNIMGIWIPCPIYAHWKSLKKHILKLTNVNRSINNWGKGNTIQLTWPWQVCFPGCTQDHWDSKTLRWARQCGRNEGLVWVLFSATFCTVPSVPSNRKCQGCYCETKSYNINQDISVKHTKIKNSTVIIELKKLVSTGTTKVVVEGGK